MTCCEQGAAQENELELGRKFEVTCMEKARQAPDQRLLRVLLKTVTQDKNATSPCLAFRWLPGPAIVSVSAWII